MAIDSSRIEEYAAKDEVRRLRNVIAQVGPIAQQSLMIQGINQPGESGPYQDKTTYPEETEGQKLEKSGQYLKDPETEVDTSQPLESRMFDIDPKKHKTQQKKQKIFNKATDPQAKGAEKDWLKKTGAQLPNFFKAIIDSRPNPADQLKIILQLLPAFTGGGVGQMAGLPSSLTIRSRLAPFTTGGPAPYDKESGSLRGVPPVLRKILLKDAMAQLPANNIRRLQPDHQTVLDDNNPGRLKIIKTFKPPRA